jgi:hypothetical protein
MYNGCHLLDLRVVCGDGKFFFDHFCLSDPLKEKKKKRERKEC